MCFESAPVLGLAHSEDTPTTGAEATRARNALWSSRPRSAKTVRTNRTMITNRYLQDVHGLHNDEARSAWSFLGVESHDAILVNLLLLADFGSSAERMRPSNPATKMLISTPGGCVEAVAAIPACHWGLICKLSDGFGLNAAISDERSGHKI